MVIKASSASEIRQLIAALDAADAIAREAAIGRLGVIGPRAVEPLLQLARTPGSRSAAAMQALEAIGDPRAIRAGRDALDSSDPSVFRTGAALLRSFVSSADAAAASSALDALVAAALDRGRPAAQRTAAVDALQDLPSAVLDPVRAALADDPDLAMESHDARTAPAADQVWHDAVGGQLPDAASAMKTALARRAPAAPLTELQHLVDAIRTREQREADDEVRAEWRALRGLAHQALAARGSRVALYDLRESLLDPEGLPVAFLAAIEAIGDASCLEPLAGAYEAASRRRDAWSREHVAAAFRAILHRERLTRRHAAVKRVMSRSPDAAAALMARR